MLLGARGRELDLVPFQRSTLMFLTRSWILDQADPLGMVDA